MSEFEFVQATKEQAKARIALAGPSGSGKTWTSLVLATGLAQGGKIAVIDTERGSASKYAGPFTFARLNLYRYDPRDLVKALAAAAKGGHDVVLIDSLSRFWSGAGGMLEVVDAAAKRSYGGNSFGGWKEARPIENDMIEAILGYPGHVIVTMRTKTAYEITKNEYGKTTPIKIGLQPEQRAGIEYEFDVVGDMDLENNLTISKSRCPELSGQVINRPDAAVAETLLTWLTEGAPAKSPDDYRDAALDTSLSRADLQDLYRRVRDAGKLAALVKDETGEMVTLAALVTRKGEEAAAAGKPAAQAPRDDWPRGTITQHNSDTPENSQPWAEHAIERTAALKSEHASEKLWREVVAKERAGEITAEDVEHIRELMAAQVEDIRTAKMQAQLRLLSENDPWRAKVEELDGDESAQAALEELGRTIAAGKIAETRGGRIRRAITARWPHATDTDPEVAA